MKRKWNSTLIIVIKYSGIFFWDIYFIWVKKKTFTAQSYALASPLGTTVLKWPPLSPVGSESLLEVSLDLCPLLRKGLQNSPPPPRPNLPTGWHPSTQVQLLPSFPHSLPTLKTLPTRGYSLPGTPVVSPSTAETQHQLAQASLPSLGVCGCHKQNWEPALHTTFQTYFRQLTDDNENNL